VRRLFGVSLLALGMLGMAFSKPSHWQNGDHQNNGKSWKDDGNGWNDNDTSQGASRLAPEINPTQAISALALLSGGILVIRRKK
jgi:hypothetical protein